MVLHHKNNAVFVFDMRKTNARLSSSGRIIDIRNSRMLLCNRNLLTSMPISFILRIIENLLSPNLTNYKLRDNEDCRVN